MNQKELGELRRRFRPDKSAISHIYGCYVSSSREIVSYLDEPLGTMPQEEVEKYLGLLKKALSGTLGKNLIDIIFTTQQVADSEEHRLLSSLRSAALKDSAARETFYQKVIAALDMDENNYLILLAHDAYDVPRRGKDDVRQEDADEVFSYLVCCVCPVKAGKVELGYFPGDNEFHCAAGQTVAAPELGFLFPAFDNRAANLYNALFYARKPDQIHHEFIDAVFHTEAPMSAAEQREAFQTALTEALEDECSMEVVHNLHDYLREKIEAHKECRDPEPLELTAKDLSGVLADSGVSEAHIEAFVASCGAQFGEAAALSPANLIDSKRFEVKTGGATISLEPERSYLVESRVIDGRRYLLIPADEEVEVNGFGVRVVGDEAEASQQEPEAEAASSKIQSDG